MMSLNVCVLLIVHALLMPAHMCSADDNNSKEGAQVLVDLTVNHQRSSMPSGYSISNTTLDFGRVEAFTIAAFTMQIEWPSPPGTESGNAGVVVRTKCTDDGLITFVSGGVMNDGVKSTATMTVQYHPQRAEGERMEHAAMIIIGTIVAFRFPVFGVWAPSRHQLTPLSPAGAAVTLRPYEPWTHPMTLFNPTDQPYHVFGYEVTNRHVRVMFLDQHDQVDQQRKNWIVPPQSSRQLGLLSTVQHQEGAFSGVFYLRLRSHPALTFALFYNFTVVAPHFRVANIGVHYTSIATVAHGLQSSSNASFFPLAALEQAQKERELLVRPIELHNYQSASLVVTDVFVRNYDMTSASSAPSNLATTAVHQRQQQQQQYQRVLGTSERVSTTRSYPYVFHRPLDSLGLSHDERRHVRETMAAQQRPCLRIVPETGSSIAPNTRGSVGLAVLNLTACLLNTAAFPHDLEPSTTASARSHLENSFTASQRLSVDLGLIFSFEHEATSVTTRQTADVTLTGWFVYGDLIPLRRKSVASSSAVRSGSGASPSNSFDDVDVQDSGAFLAIVPASSSAVPMEPVELLMYNAFRFPIKQQSPSIHTQLRGVSVEAARAQVGSGESSGTIVHMGNLVVDAKVLRESLGAAPIAEIILRTTVEASSPACSTLSSSTNGASQCIPGGTVVATRARLITSPLLLTRDVPPGSSSDEVSMAHCQSHSDIALLLHPNGRYAYCVSTIAPLRQLSFGVHQVTKSSHDTNEILATQRLVLTNPHNLSVNILEVGFAPTVSEGGRATPLHAFLRVAPASMHRLKTEYPPQDVSNVDAIAFLPRGASVDLELQLVCPTKGNAACKSKGQQLGSFTVRTVSKTPGRQPVLQQISVPVSFAVMEEMSMTVQQPPVLQWSDRRLIVHNGMKVLAIDVNITVKAQLSSPIPLSPVQCLWVPRMSSDEATTAEVLHAHPPIEPHAAYETIWQRDNIPSGDFNGPVATIRYFPTHRSTATFPASCNGATDLSGASSTAGDGGALNDRVLGLASMSLGVTEINDGFGNDPSGVKGVVHKVRSSLAKDEGLATARRCHNGAHLSSTSAFLTEQEILAFATSAVIGAGDSSRHQEGSCYLSLFGPLTASAPSHAPSKVLPQWATMISGEHGLPSFLHHVVDFGGLTPQSSHVIEPQVASEYITIVNTQSTSVMVQPLLWSQSSSRLPHAAKSILQESVRQAFQAYRASPVARAETSRDAAASFRIPDEVWGRPSTTFELRGNATSPLTLQPFERVVIGPITYRPSALTSDPSVTRVVDRDVLILRNNHSGIDAVLVVGKVGKPVVHLAELSSALFSQSVLSNAEPKPLSGDILGNATLTSLRALSWNVSEDDVASWAPRATGFASWLDLYRHWAHAGLDHHAMQLSTHVAYRDAVEEGWLPLSLRPDHLRQFIVPGEFDASGNMALIDPLNSEDGAAADIEASLKHPAVRARVPVYFSKSSQIVNKGSFLLNVSSLTLRNGKCTDGELRIFPCILPSGEDIDVRATTSDAAWDVLFDTLNMTQILTSSPSGLPSTNLLIPPRHALAIKIFWMPNFFANSVASSVVIGHAGGVSTTVFPIVATLPVSSTVDELRFSSMRTFSSSLVHAAVTSVFVVLVLVGSCAVMRVWTSSKHSLIAGPPASTAVKQLAPVGSTAVNAASAKTPSAGGATRTQVVQARKARKEALDLYQNQQTLQSAQNRLSSGVMRHAVSSAAEIDDTADQQQDEDAIASSATSRSSSVPPQDEIASIHTAAAAAQGSEVPAAPTLTVDGAAADTAHIVHETAKSKKYEVQRAMRRLRREQSDLATEEVEIRDRIVTEQLAFIGQVLLEWNSSDEVKTYHELKAIERLREQVRLQEQQAAEAAELAAKKAVIEQQRREANERRKQAEENIRNNDETRRAAAEALKAAAAVAVRAAPAIAQTGNTGSSTSPPPPLRSHGTPVAARRHDRVHIPVVARNDERSPIPTTAVGGDTTRSDPASPADLARHPSFGQQVPSNNTRAGGPPVAIDHDQYSAPTPSQLPPSPSLQQQHQQHEQLVSLLQRAIGTGGVSVVSASAPPAPTPRYTVAGSTGSVHTSPAKSDVSLFSGPARGGLLPIGLATEPKATPLRDRLTQSQVGVMPPPVGFDDVDEVQSRLSLHFGHSAHSSRAAPPPPPLPPAAQRATPTTSSPLLATYQAITGIMGRGVAEEEEFLPRRLPSDFTFEEPAERLATTGAAIGDYSAFFGSSTHPNMFTTASNTAAPPLAGARPIWNAGGDFTTSTTHDDERQPNQSSNPTATAFSLFGGGNW